MSDPARPTMNRPSLLEQWLALSYESREAWLRWSCALVDAELLRRAVNTVNWFAWGSRDG